MEKLVDFITENLTVFIMAIFGTITPGILTIGIFDRDLLLQLDFLKLIVLAGSISIPSLAFLFGISLFSLIDERNTRPDIIRESLMLALVINIFIFSIAILIKIFINNITLEKYTCILIFSFLIYLLLSSFILNGGKKKRK